MQCHLFFYSVLSCSNICFFRFNHKNFKSFIRWLWYLHALTMFCIISRYKQNGINGWTFTTTRSQRCALFIVILVLHVISFFLNNMLYHFMGLCFYTYLNNNLNFIDEIIHSVQKCVCYFVQIMTFMKPVEIRVLK